jgi:hypothetical protein
LSGPQIRSERRGVEKFFCLCRESKVGRPVRRYTD